MAPVSIEYFISSADPATELSGIAIQDGVALGGPIAGEEGSGGGIFNASGSTLRLSGHNRSGERSNM
jgi:hypothetical protein